jgi:hypothetical protein
VSTTTTVKGRIDLSAVDQKQQLGLCQQCRQSLSNVQKTFKDYMLIDARILYLQTHSGTLPNATLLGIPTDCSTDILG